MRKTVSIFILLLLLQIFPPVNAQTSRPVTRIAFGSCADQDKPQPIWNEIIKARPDVFILLGDNVYGDTQNMDVLRAKYAKLAAVPGFRQLRRMTTLMGTWDDHDYGVNDGGEEYPKRAESQQIFLDFFGEPKNSPRRKREGVYDARVFGPAGKRVQIISLDTRYFRSPLRRRGEEGGRGPYVADLDRSKTILGEAQWKWLAEQLRVPSEVRLIISSIQVVAEDHGWEKWMNFPYERQKLFDLIRETGAGGVIFVTGDRHLAELSMMDGGVGYPLYDLTASALNRSSAKWRTYEANKHRVGTMNWGDNFGMITIDWNRPDPRITLQIVDEEGDVNIGRKINLGLLQPKKD